MLIDGGILFFLLYFLEYITFTPKVVIKVVHFYIAN